MDRKRQTCIGQDLCFCTPFSVKGSELRKTEVLHSKLGKNISLQMWTPKTSVVVVPPDLKIKGVCLAHERKQAHTIPVTKITASEGQSDIAQIDISRIESNFGEQKHDVNNGKKGNMLLTVLEASLKKKLNPEYIHILPWRLNRSTVVRSAQYNGASKQFRLYPRQSLKEERLPAELKFGVRNPRKSNSAACKKSEVLRTKAEVNPYRGKLEPLLLREKPSKNLHDELVREEAREFTGTLCT